MVASVQTAATTTIGISASLPSTFDSDAMTGYPSATYTLIGEVVSMSEFGTIYNPVNHLPLASRQVVKFKGSYDNGNLSLNMARDDDDAGQVICLSALSSDNDHAFEIIYQDGSEDYFTGKVMSFTSVASGADSIVNRTMAVGLTRDVVSVAP